MDTDILGLLSQGDMRTIGASNKIALKAFQNNTIIKILVNALTNDNPEIRMRAADALEKIGAKNQKLIQPYKTSLLSIADSAQQQEVQWHMAQIIQYLHLSLSEVKCVEKTLFRYYNESKSNIVKTFSLNALVSLSKENPDLLKKVKDLLNKAVLSDQPSIRSRAKKLVVQL